MSYKDSILEGLIDYKKNEMEIEDPGIFRYRGRNLKKDHILPQEFISPNILEKYRESFYASKLSSINFHRYFHHLNSSQAMCINLFLPFIFEKGLLKYLFSYLNLPAEKMDKAEFEKKSDVEIMGRGGRKTNFDFFIQTKIGNKFYFEIKYTENGFASTHIDEKHIKKFSNTYSSLLTDNMYINEEYKSMDSFLSNYQIMRNLVHIAEKRYVIFVIPKQNKKVYNQATEAERNILSATGKKYFKILTIEEFLNYILNLDLNNSLITEYFMEFKKKYFSRSV
ncbi:MAG: hypothetical protein KAT05_11905 [Spirochaetes bacterium]|nr:hypothetical protein [Spirochaetota bacterium]